jgi:hypothetical protein
MTEHVLVTGGAGQIGAESLLYRLYIGIRSTLVQKVFLLIQCAGT